MKDLIETNRKNLNKKQTKLREILTSTTDFKSAVRTLLDQHASMHTAEVGRNEVWSFEDAVLDGIDESIYRLIPTRSEHSIAWCIWHIARIEDITMNMLISGKAQLFSEQNWQERLKIDYLHSGNQMTKGDIERLSKMIDLEALRDYRKSIGFRTREIIGRIQPDQLKVKVSPSRIEKILEEKAVLDCASGITDYWSKRTIAGLLLMPATRHNIVHLNEAYRLKMRLDKLGGR